MTTLHLLQSGFHAIERLTAAESWEMGGALGVAADPYPHQINNLRRILADTEIRHLLADEVGLGKTIQALMVLNVLRRRDPSLRVAIVAPERICYQWQVELSARGHVAARIITDEAEPDESPEGEGYVHIIKADLIRRQPARPSPEAYDMLIVDEIHALNLEDAAFLSSLCRERRDASRFRHVLLLTATPRLGNPAWARAVIGAIEPERAEIANLLGKEPFDLLTEEAEAARERVTSGAISASAFATAVAADRRILRQTRGDHPGIAPIRKVHTVRTAPSDAEMPRCDLQNAACRSASDSPLEAAPWLQCRQMFLSATSLRKVLRHRTFAEYPELRDEVDTTLLRNPGNALFDDLCDVLLDFWHGNSDRRVIIIAGDTPTVDMLKRRLSEMFPHLAEDGIATMRGRHNTGLVDVVSAVESHATILIMEEFVEAGLNLHNVASDMIFYNLPWQAARIDQLIGRLDRLRSGGLSAYIKDRSVGTIGIWRMVVAGSADERVLEALDLLDVFEHPLPFLDDELSKRIDSIITDAAAGRANFRAAAQALKEELFSGLAQHSRMTPSDEAERQTETDELIKRIRTHERAGNDWLRLMHLNKIFKGGFPKANDEERVATLAMPTLIEACPYSLGAMTSREHEVFRWRRDRLGRPPKKDVVLPGDEVGKRAHFFATGDDLHDDLVRQALAVAHAQAFSPKPIGVVFSQEHLASELVGKTILLIRSAARPSTILDRQFLRHESDAEAIRIGRDADRRWLSALFPDSVRTNCLVVCDDGTIDVAPEGTARALLSDASRQTTNRKQQQIIPALHDAKRIINDVERRMALEERQRLSLLRDAALRAFADRRQVLMEETENYVRWKQLSVAQFQSRNISDLQQIQMNEGQINAERRRMEARITSVTDRIRTLEDCILKLATPVTAEVLVILARVLPPVHPEA